MIAWGIGFACGCVAMLTIAAFRLVWGARIEHVGDDEVGMSELELLSQADQLLFMAIGQRKMPWNDWRQ